MVAMVVSPEWREPPESTTLLGMVSYMLCQQYFWQIWWVKMLGSPPSYGFFFLKIYSFWGHKKVDWVGLSWMWANAGTTSQPPCGIGTVSDGECGLYKICAVREPPTQSFHAMNQFKKNVHVHEVAMSQKTGSEYVRISYLKKTLKPTASSSSVFMILSET